MNCVVVDIETTGLSPTSNCITEIGAVKLREGKVIDEFHTMINPQCPIPQDITRITGITNDMVRDAPCFHEIAEEFLAFCEDHCIVAHNAGFDLSFLKHNAQQCNLELNNPHLCTVKLAWKALPELYNKKLGTLCDVFKIPNDQAHRALSDARATAQVLLKLQDILDMKKIVITPKSF